MSGERTFFQLREDGVDLLVRLTPRAARDGFDGIGETADGRVHLKARVRAVPEDGKANSALERIVAKALGLPRSAVGVKAGRTARLKTVRIVGETAQLAGRLRELGQS